MVRVKVDKVVGLVEVVVDVTVVWLDDGIVDVDVAVNDLVKVEDDVLEGVEVLAKLLVADELVAVLLSVIGSTGKLLEVESFA